MFKKSLFTIVFCLVLGAGVLHASSNGPVDSQLDSITAVDNAESLSITQDDAVQCLEAPQADSAEAAAGYECPIGSSYCRRNSDCNEADGEVCESGCCLAAW